MLWEAALTSSMPRCGCPIAYPLQSSAGKMEMKMRIQLDGLSRDGENTDVGTSQMPPSVQKTPSPELYPLHDA
jgi:hypothetical protein